MATSHIRKQELTMASLISFRSLVSDAPNTATIVARFLALLELYREGVLHFDQVSALGELQVKWIGQTDVEVEVNDEFDQEIANNE